MAMELGPSGEAQGSPAPDHDGAVFDGHRRDGQPTFFSAVLCASTSRASELTVDISSPVRHADG